MIGYLPPIYKDELFSSYLMRLYMVSPYIYPKNFMSEIFINKKERMNYLYLNKLNSNFEKLIDKQFGVKEVIRNHTLSYYENLFGRFTGVNPKKQLLRYCPICIKESNEAYFQVLPQIRELKYCPIHGAEFLDSDVSINRDKNYLIRPIPGIKSSEPKLASRGSKEWLLSKYTYDVINAPITSPKHAKTHIFLREHISKKYYIASNGFQLNILKIKNALDNFYSGIDYCSLSTRQIKRVLTGESYNPFQVILIAFWLDIPAKELANRKIRREVSFKSRVLNLRNKGLSEREIAKQLNVSKTNIHKTIKGGLKNE